MNIVICIDSTRKETFPPLVYIYCAQNLAGALYREFNNVHFLYRYKAFNVDMYQYMYSFIFSFYTIYSYFLLILLLCIAGSSGFSI